MLPGGVVRAHLFSVRPVKPKMWEALVVVEFPVAVVGNRAPGATYDFGATVKSGQTIAHIFNRRIQLASMDGGVHGLERPRSEGTRRRAAAVGR